MASIKALYIPTDIDAEVELVEFESGDLSFMQQKVGGYIQPADGDDDHPLSIWIDEDGKTRGREINRRATLLLYVANPVFIDRDILVGDALVTGLPDDIDGDTQSAPQELLDLVLNTSEYKIEVQAPGPDWNSNQMRYDSYWEALSAAYSLSTRWTLVTAWRASAA